MMFGEGTSASRTTDVVPGREHHIDEVPYIDL